LQTANKSSELHERFEIAERRSVLAEQYVIEHRLDFDCKDGL